MEQLPYFELKINPEDGARVEANALVDVPAHMKNFVSFNEEDLAYKFNDDEKRIVHGVMISANTPIYRNANRIVNEPHMVVFKPETIEKARQVYMKENRGSNINEMHDQDRFLDGVHLIDSYIVGGPNNPAVPEVFKHLNIQDGTWFAAYHVENDMAWAKVKSGEFNGFSVEGIFEMTPLPLKTKMAKGKFATIQEVNKWDVEVDQDTFDEGTKLTTSWVDEMGETHTNKLNDGEYMLEDGRRILVDADGVIRNIFKQQKPKRMKKGFSILGITFGSTESQFVDVTAVDGTVLSYEGELAVGTPIFVVGEEDEQLPAPAGQYQVEVDATNWILTVDDNGVIESMEEVEAMEDDQVDEDEFTAANFKAWAEAYDAKQQEQFKELKASVDKVLAENKRLKESMAHMQTAMNSKFNYTPKKTNQTTTVQPKDLF